MNRIYGLFRFALNPWLYLISFWFGGISLSALGIAQQVGQGWAMLYAGVWLMVSAAIVFRGLTSNG